MQNTFSGQSEGLTWLGTIVAISLGLRADVDDDDDFDGSCLNLIELQQKPSRSLPQDSLHPDLPKP